MVYTYLWPVIGMHVFIDKNGKGVMRMIRVNVHFDSSWLKRLDEIKDQLMTAEAGHWRLYNITRADLIRYAVAMVFGFDLGYVHVDKESLSEGLKKVLKKSAPSKRV